MSGSSDNTARVWDVGAAKCVLVLDSLHTDSVRCVDLKVIYKEANSKPYLTCTVHVIYVTGNLSIVQTGVHYIELISLS